MSAELALLRKDVRVIYRDSFLLFMVAYVPLLAIGLRLAVTWVPIDQIELYVAPWVVGFGASLLAAVFGFGMIEEREQRTDLLLRVVPLTTLRYFVYLVATTGIFAFLLGLLAALLFGRPVADLPGFLVMTAIGSLQAPMGMLFLGVAARNKIEGMALAKVLSSVSFVPVLIFVLPVPWQLLLVWSPHYWIYLGLLRSYAVEAQLMALPLHWPLFPVWLPAVAGFALSVAGIAVLARIYRRRIH